MLGMAVPTTEVFRAISMKAKEIPTMAAKEAKKLRSDCSMSDVCGFLGKKYAGAQRKTAE